MSEELLKQPRDRKDDIWIEKVEAYSYVMTCYEVLTGHSLHLFMDIRRIGGELLMERDLICQII